MLIKKPKYKRESYLFNTIKFIVFGEIVIFGGSYLLWRQMNHSRDFRYYMHQKAPIILDAFYGIGTAFNQYYNLKERDEQVWATEAKLTK